MFKLSRDVQTIRKIKENNVKRALLLFGLFIALAAPSGLWSQQAGYSQTNLVSNIAGVGKTDTQLVNPWGISVLPGDDFWIADNNSGVSTLYDQNGNKATGLVVTIPGATSNPNGNCSPGCPTGTVGNGNGTYFTGGSFIFDTEDGLIVYWNGSSNTAIIGKDNSASGAVYKGLALLGTNLLATNFNSGKVDVYDSNFNLTTSIADPMAPAGYAPHGIHVIGNQVYVALALQDTAKHDAVPGAGSGQVDIFDAKGNFVSTFVAAGANNNLNAPWGVVQAPASFGTFAGDILVGNFGDGTISAFDTTGKFVGQLTDSSGSVLVIPGLWDMVFGGGGGANNNPGALGTLYITGGGSAGQPNFPAGGSATAVFASIVPAAAVGTPGFSLNLSSMSTTVTPGGSTSLMVSAAAVGGFNGQVALTCSAPAGLTCAFKPFDDISRVERFVLHVDHRCGSYPAVWRRRLHRARHDGPAAWSGAVRDRSDRPQTEAAYAQEHPVDEPAGFAACRFTVRSWMRWQQLKQTNNAGGPTGHREGDGHIRRTEPVRRCNCHHQLDQNNSARTHSGASLPSPDPEQNMLELMSYGLTGLAVAVVVAFCFAYGDEFPLLEQHSIDLTDKPHSLPSWQSGERNAGAIYSGVPNESARREVFRV